MNAPMPNAVFNWEDPLLLDEQLSEDERMVRDSARAYAQDKLMPRVVEANRHERFDREVLTEMGAARLPGLDLARLRLRRREPCVLRPDRARDRARRLELSLEHERAIEPGDVSDLRLRQRSAAAEISAGPRDGRADRLLRTDRAQLRLRCRRHGHARAQGRRRLGAERRQDVDHAFARRRRIRRLGEGRRRRDPRVHSRERHEGAVRAEDSRQVQLAHFDHRRDRDGRCLRARRELAAERERAQRTVRLSQQGALRHRLGRDGRRRVLLARGAPVHARSACSSAGRSPPIS